MSLSKFKDLMALNCPQSRPCPRSSVCPTENLCNWFSIVNLYLSQRLVVATYTYWLGSLATILLSPSLLLLLVYVLQRRVVWDIEFGSLWLHDFATLCATLSICQAQFLTNKMTQTQKCYHFQVIIPWLFSDHMQLRIPDQNPFE